MSPATPKQVFEIIVCPKCGKDDIYFQEVGSKTVFRCYNCHIVFRERREE